MKKTLPLLLFAILIITAKVSLAQEAPKEEFKPSGKLWGYAFGDYAFKAHSDALNRGNQEYSNVPKNFSSFDFRRIYLGYDYNISEKFTSQLLLAHESLSESDANQNDLLSNSRRGVYIKLANLRWKNIYKNADLVIGQSETPSFPMLTEKVWGYRSIERTILDARRGGSNDLGVAIQGKFNNAGTFGYNVMVGNGTGAKLEGDKFKKIYADVYAKLLNQKLILDWYEDYEIVQQSPYAKSRYTAKGFIAYQTEKFTVGVEAFMQNQPNYTILKGIPDSLRNAFTVGISGFIKGSIIKDKLGFFARYDIYKPDLNYDAKKTYASSYKFTLDEDFATAGIDFTPHKNVHIIPNVWYNSYKSKANNLSGTAKSDYDLAARLTFHYIFK